jgi:hypothetical protein
MPALVTNFGNTRAFPTCIGNVHIAHSQTVNMDNDKALREIEKFPCVKVEWLTRKKRGTPRPSASELWSLPINTLRRMATRLGIKGVFTMKKKKIIEQMEA